MPLETPGALNPVTGLTGTAPAFDDGNKGHFNDPSTYFNPGDAFFKTGIPMGPNVYVATDAL